MAVNLGMFDAIARCRVKYRVRIGSIARLLGRGALGSGREYEHGIDLTSEAIEKYRAYKLKQYDTCSSAS